MPFSVAESIFNAQNYEDPAIMRGRNSVAPLNKMGLCIAKNSAEGIRITPLGEYFLSEDYDLGKFSLAKKNCLKGEKNSSPSDLLHKSMRGGQAIKNLFVAEHPTFRF